MPQSRGVGWAIVAALGLLLGTVTCYGPTELTVNVSTDLACAATPKVALFLDGDAPVADTSACNDGVSGAELGSLVLVPSGSRSGRATIHATLAPGSKTVDDCSQDATDCIFASRSFSFLPHSARELPLRLYSSCRGKRCQPGQTCDASGECVSDEVVCVGDGCRLAAEPPLGEPDASTDASVDGGCPAPPPLVNGSRVGDAVASRSSSPKTIDGKLDDWGSCASFDVDFPHAAKTLPPPGASSSATASFFAAWDASYLYVAARVTDATRDVDPDRSSSPVDSDSIEVFVSFASPLTDPNYNPTDHHLAISRDPTRAALDYSATGASNGLPPPNVVPATDVGVADTADGYVVELRIPVRPDIDGALVSQRVVHVDAMLNDGLGQKAVAIWALQPGCKSDNCSGNCACGFSPAFDVLTFAPLRLE